MGQSRLMKMKQFGILLLLAQLCFASARTLNAAQHTFPPAAPAAVKVLPPAFQPNVQAKAAPMPMGRDPMPMITLPLQQPVAAAAAAAAAPQAGAHNMRLAAPIAAPAAAATTTTPAAALQAAASASAQHIPFAYSVPYNPNSVYKQMSVQATQTPAGVATASTGYQLPDSHPVGIPQATAEFPDRPRSVIGLVNSGAHAAVAALSKLWQQRRGQQGAEADTSVDNQQQQQQVQNAQVASQAAQPAPAPAPATAGAAPVAAGSAAPTALLPQSLYQQSGPSGVSTAAVTPVAAAQTPQGSSVSIASLPAAASSAVRSSSSKPAAASAAAALTAMPAGYVGPAFGEAPAQPAMQPLAAGLARMAVNNMGAPMSGPLGGPTYIAKPAAAVAAAAAPAASQDAAAAAAAASPAAADAKVAIASIGSSKSSSSSQGGSKAGSSSSAVSVAAAASNHAVDAVQQHFAAAKPPMYAPLDPTLQVPPSKSKVLVAATKSSKAAPAGPSLDDLSDMTGAPVAHISWQLPKKTHVAFAPAADLRAAPVSPFELPRSMQQALSSDDTQQASKGDVSHSLTPTWAPAA